MRPVNLPLDDVPTGSKPVTVWGNKFADALPAYFFPTEGMLMSNWQLSHDELSALVRGAKLELYVWPFGGSMQPVSLRVSGVDYDEDNL